MASIFIDGFDKYGPATINESALGPLIQGEWTVYNLGNSASMIYLVSPLSAEGQALQFTSNGIGFASLSKTLGTTHGTFIGGFRFKMTALGTNSVIGGFLATSGGGGQWGVQIATTGQLQVASGGVQGTVLGTSVASVAVGVAHYLEFQVTVGSAGAYQVWLDGVSVLSGTGNTAGAGGTTSDGFEFRSANFANNPSFVVDDFYLFDDTGQSNNAPLLTNPQIITTFPTSDSAKAFSFGAGVLGASGAYQGSGGTNAPGANTLFLRQYTPQDDSTLASVSCMPAATSAGANFQPVCYADAAGSPGALLSGGAQITGTTAGTALTGNLTSAQALVAGTSVWVGFITDTSVALSEADGGTTGAVAANTYTSGAPANAPAMTTGQPDWMVWGNLSAASANWARVGNNPGVGDLGFVYSATAGQEDLYDVGTIIASEAVSIYTVAAKALVRRTDTGARTFTLQCKSGANDSSGSAPAGTPGTTYAWMGSFFDIDPGTGLAWSVGGRNTATFGEKIAT